MDVKRMLVPPCSEATHQRGGLPAQIGGHVEETTTSIHFEDAETDAGNSGKLAKHWKGA